jgi:uncharacterized protein YjiS (DUF1127 family)
MLNTIRKMANGFAAYERRRATYRLLRNLDARTLRDIGLERPGTRF